MTRVSKAFNNTPANLGKSRIRVRHCLKCGEGITDSDKRNLEQVEKDGVTMIGLVHDPCP